MFRDGIRFGLLFLAAAGTAAAQSPGGNFGGSPFVERQANPPGLPPGMPGGTATNLLLNEQPPPPPPPKIWSGGLEFGVNGSSGNSEQVNARAGWNATRKTSDNIFTTDFLYAYAKQDSKTSQNQMILNARDEILYAGSPWTLFGSTNIEYDELRAYKFRIGVYAGVGYIVVNDDTTLFKLRAGAGAVREIGGPKDRWVPELDFGYDYNVKFTDRQSFVSNLDYYPRIDNFAQYRVRSRAAYEIVVDPESGTALRLGAQLRYDSDPGPAKRTDLTYFLTLLMKF